MSADNSNDYDRGLKEAERHAGYANPNWVRATFGPILWLGVPLAATYWYLNRRPGAFTQYIRNLAKGKKNSNGDKTKKDQADNNPFSGMMEMMMPIQRREFKVDVKGTKFADVIGIPEAKDDVRQYVDFLTHPDKYTRLGARLPKGCILTGEPGTGKTLLAKAMAGEADVPFFSCSGADFIEVMGGSGPKRVRELFDDARKESPCIVFIDELDAIGSRGNQNSTGGSISSEENRTINQLLAELDGLNTGPDGAGHAIIVLAATNFVDNIDKALLREGRFDRKVNIDMPDLHARVEVFQYYLSKIATGDPSGHIKNEKGEEIVKPDSSISNDKLARTLSELTPGISPATITAIINEGALTASIDGSSNVSEKYLMEAIDNVMIGKKQERNRLSGDAVKRTAIHEAGHAFVAWMLPQQKDVLKISVTPRGNALGYTQRAGTEYHEYQTNATLFSDLCVLLGGRSAEEVLLGDASVGAMDDVQKATEMALRKLVCFGMSSNTGLLAYDMQETQKGRSFVHFSEGTQMSIEREAQRIVEEAHKFARDVIEKNRGKVSQLATELEEKKDLLTVDCVRLWGERPKSPTTEEWTKLLDRSMYEEAAKIKNEQQQQQQVNRQAKVA